MARKEAGASTYTIVARVDGQSEQTTVRFRILVRYMVSPASRKGAGRQFFRCYGLDLEITSQAATRERGVTDTACLLQSVQLDENVGLIERRVLFDLLSRCRGQ